MRIPADRPGYDGYTCEGIPQDTLPPADCSAEPYYKLPGDAREWVANFSWENLSALETDPRLSAIRGMCGTIIDPFEGISVDLYTGFLDNGYAGFIPDDCYDPGGGSQEYTEGTVGVEPFVIECVCGAGGS